MYTNIIVFIFLMLLLFLDKIFLPKSAVRAVHTLLVAYLVLFLTLVFPSVLQFISNAIKIGRPVDLLLYGAFVLFLRELVISRYKYQVLNKSLTDLTRELAIKNVQRR